MHVAAARDTCSMTGECLQNACSGLWRISDCNLRSLPPSPRRHPVNSQYHPLPPQPSQHTRCHANQHFTLLQQLHFQLSSQVMQLFSLVLLNEQRKHYCISLFVKFMMHELFKQAKLRKKDNLALSTVKVLMFWILLFLHILLAFFVQLYVYQNQLTRT